MIGPSRGTSRGVHSVCAFPSFRQGRASLPLQRGLPYLLSPAPPELHKIRLAKNYRQAEIRRAEDKSTSMGGGMTEQTMRLLSLARGTIFIQCNAETTPQTRLFSFRLERLLG